MKAGVAEAPQLTQREAVRGHLANYEAQVRAARKGLNGERTTQLGHSRRNAARA